MAQTFKHIIPCLLALLLVSCVSELDLPQNTEGQGMFALSLSASGLKTEVETRADEDSWQELTSTEAASYLITLIKDSKTLWGPKVFSSINQTDCTQPVGQGYVVSAENCTTAEAESANNGWGQRRYYGKSSSFSITKDETTDVRINCHIANAGLSVQFDESFTTYFTLGYSVTTDDSRGLRFDENTTDNDVAYYNIPEESTRTVHLLVNASAGWDGILHLEHDLVMQPGRIYRLQVRKGTVETGTMGVTITTEDFVEGESEEVIVE